MSHGFDAAWALLIAAIFALLFMFWVFFNFLRDSRRKRQRDENLARGRGEKPGVWE